MSGLDDHLASGATHRCHAWAVTRRDGVVLGFTDHDALLRFDGIEFRPGGGMSALALQQTTGLSVDNSETLGALSDEAIRAEDLDAGLYDGAELRAWQVRWDKTEQRKLLFRGTIGEIARKGASFTAELRGLTEQLSQPGGRVFHRLCPAVLGDKACGCDLEAFSAEARVLRVEDGVLILALSEGVEEGWFDRGVLRVLDGAAAGASGVIRSDRIAGTERRVSLWTPMSTAPEPGDRLRVVAGCDKRLETCRDKFSNTARFRGFPHIPGEDWLVSVPRSEDANEGGSLFR